jgi:hypothetical protein
VGPGPVDPAATSAPKPYSNFSVEFDGVDEYANVIVDGYISNLTQLLTVSMWAKLPASTGSFQQLLHRGGTGSTVIYSIQRLGGTGNNRFNVTIAASNLNRKQYQTSSTVWDGGWHQCAFTFLGGSPDGYFALFVDGYEETSPIQTEDALVTEILDIPGRLELTLGAFFAHNTVSYLGHLEGFVSEMTIWEAQFTETEMLELYNDGLPADPTTHSRSTDLRGHWRLGEGDTFPTLQDGYGSNDLTMTNMEAADIIHVSPP